MKLKSTLFITVATLSLVGCSDIHYTTDLNKIRSTYYSTKNSEKINLINKNRQGRISIKNETAYTKGINCLSQHYLTQVLNVKRHTKQAELNKLEQQSKEIALWESLLEKAYKTGGFQMLKRTEGGVGFKYDDKKFPLTISQYVLNIHQLDQEIEFLKLRQKTLADNQKIIAKITEREMLNIEMEELKTNINAVNKLLEEAKKAKENAGEQIEKLKIEEQSTNDVYLVAVSDIYDKTHKVFPESSTAISEMVAHALSHNYGIKLVDTPFGRDWSNSRYNPLENSTKDILKQSPSLLSSSTGFAGIVFPSDMYISGALIQYDELPATKAFGTNISVNIDPLDLSSETRTITVGIVLRLVGTTNGLVLDDSNSSYVDTEKKLSPEEYMKQNFESKSKSNRASVYLQNTYFVKKIGANVFEINSKRLYGGNVSVEVSDPATYVVNEIVEAGVYELLKKALRKEQEISSQARIACDTLVKDDLSNKSGEFL